MSEGLPPAGSLEHYNGQMRWEAGRAGAYCRDDQCEGPQVGNLSLGPDYGGHMIIRACNAACARCIRDGMPAGAWVTHSGTREILHKETGKDT